MEAEYALKCSKEALPERPLEIVPIILEGPPPRLPADSLQEIHFNDPIRCSTQCRPLPYDEAHRGSSPSDRYPLSGLDGGCGEHAPVRELAANADTAFIPQCGLAPGFVSIVASDLAKGFEVLDSVRLRVGVLPQYPSNALNYNLTWSTDGVINEYCEACEAIVNGVRREVSPLEEREGCGLRKRYVHSHLRRVPANTNSPLPIPLSLGT
jgi:Saccharopine dehydrogenase C-terminal domain